MGDPTVMATTRRKPWILAVGLLILAAIVAGCGGSAAPSTAAVDSNGPAPGNGEVSAVPSAAQTAIPSSAAAASAVATTPVPSLAALPLLWQKAGSSGVTTAVYWPAVDPKTGNVWVTSSPTSRSEGGVGLRIGRLERGPPRR